MTLRPESIEARWWEDRREHLNAGLGFLNYRSSLPPLHGRAPDFSIYRLEDTLPDGSDRNSALILPPLTQERLGDSSFVQRAGSAAAGAARIGLAVIAATPLSERLFAATSGTAEDEPWDLNIDALVGGTDLAYVLESCCLARVNGGGDAAYLTPIEARLARALDDAGIAYRRQHFIGYYCVDFLVNDVLVVECDGIGYHDVDSDRARDAELQERGYSVLRLSGRLIHHDTLAAVGEVKARLSGVEPRLPRADEGLSKSQSNAASHRSGPARVSAPAGSGKTRVIAARVKALVAAGVEPSRICAISFTNKAVEEMRRRLPEADAAGTRFTTIHSLAKLISEGGPHGRPRRLIQGGRSSRTPTRWQVLAPLLSEEERFWRARDVWLDAINAYRQCFTVPDLTNFPPAKRPSPHQLVELHQQYDAELEGRGLTDFEGYILNAVRALARSADYRRHWASQHDYWVVDEYQDLPAAKLSLLRLLASPRDNLFVVGDDDQIIYGFAGADPQSFADFPSIYPRAVDFLLGDNHRCEHEIVVRSSWLISRNARRVAKTIRPVKPAGPPGSVRIGDATVYDEEALRFVKGELERGVQPHEIALLFRLKDFAAPVEHRLEKAGVSYVPCSYSSFFDKRVVTLVRAWLRLAADAGSADDLRETLKWPKRYLRSDHLDLVVSALGAALVSRHAACSAALQAARQVSDGQKRDALDKWTKFVGQLGDGSSPSEILDLLALRSVAEEIDVEPGEAAAVVTFDVFARLASEFETVASLEAWIAARGDDRDYSFETVDPAAASVQEGRVLLASIHQVKGQEYKSVAVLGPPDGMPDRRATTPEQIEEERRIAYVAVTRAESSLLFAASPAYASELAISPDGETWEAYQARARSRPSAGHGRAILP